MQELASGFGYKTAWLALHGASADAVARALRLEQVRECGWSEGVAQSYASGDSAFVTPPLSGTVSARAMRSRARYGAGARNSVRCIAYCCYEIIAIADCDQTNAVQ